MKKQSQIFDCTRFCNCLKRELILDGRSLLLKWVVLIATLSVMLYIVNNPNTHNYVNNQSGAAYMIFCNFGFLTLTLGASLFMQDMTTNGNRLNSLMSPSSTLEKYLSRWLIYVVGVAIAFLTSFAIAEGLRVLITKAFYGDIPGLHYVLPSEFPQRDNEGLMLYVGLLTAQATFVLGSTVAPKNAFLKTAGVIAVLTVAFFTAVSNTFLALNPEGLVTPEANYIVSKVVIIAPICWTVFCYITAYFRMKESEIIERL